MLTNAKYNLSVALLIAIFFVFSANTALASTNIAEDDSDSCGGAGTFCQWAWNDAVGWIDFYTNDSVFVISTPTNLRGAAELANIERKLVYLNCSAISAPDNCTGDAGDWGVFYDNILELSGWAWSETFGWVSFSCETLGNCASSDYRVFIDKDTGVFSGFAWSVAVGWISFNCGNDHDGGASGVQAVCDTSAYKVKANLGPAPGEREISFSEVLPTNTVLPVALNSIIWDGELAGGGTGGAEFQIASSLSEEGPWNFVGPSGIPGGSDAYPITGPHRKPGELIPIETRHHTGLLHYRIKLIKVANEVGEFPTVDSIYVNWSY